MWNPNLYKVWRDRGEAPLSRSLKSGVAPVNQTTRKADSQGGSRRRMFLLNQDVFPGETRTVHKIGVLREFGGGGFS